MAQLKNNTTIGGNVFTVGTSAYFITTGEVGIGTSTVSGAKYAVFGGNIRIGSTSTGLLFPDGSFQTVAYPGASGLVTTFSAGTTGLTPSTNTSGAITLGGTLGVANGGTGATTFTANGILYGNTTGAIQVTAQGGANTILTANAGAPSFSATPTIGTSVTVPLVIGGTAASSSLTLQSTSGTGTSDSILFKVGNNGATTAITVDTNGRVGIGTSGLTTATLAVWGSLPAWFNTVRTSDPAIIVGNSTSTGTTLAQASDLSYSYVKHNATGSAIIAWNNTGVGINNLTSPKNALDVNGAAVIGGSIGYAGSATAPANGLLVAGSVGIGTTSTSNKLYVYGGNIQIDTGSNNFGILFSDGTYQRTAYPGSTGVVTTFSAGTTGLTPSTNTSGAITLGGTLGLTNGGTNASLTASNGGVIYSTASAFAVLAGTATAGQHLQSGASGAPSWTTATFPGTATGTGTILRADGTNWVATTATYPATTTANQLLYSSAANTVGGLTSANTAALVTNNSGVPAFTAGTTANRVLRTDGTTISFAQVALGTDVSGTLAVGSGGTGLTSYTQGDLIYATAATTIGRLADVATGNVLISGGVSADPSWGKVGLTTHVSGTLPVGNGGTGLTSYTTGDIVYASAAGTLASLADVATGNVVISGGVGVAPSYGKVGLTTHVTGTLGVANGGTGLTSGTQGGVLYYSAAGTLASSGGLTASALVVGGGASGPSTITTGTGVTTALGVNTGTAGAFVVNGGALGTPSSGNLISCTALPLSTGVTGTLALTNGGTNASLTASNGGVIYSTASAFAVLAGTATAGQHLQSGASGAPSWTTATFPGTATGTGTILRADGTNWVATTATYPATTTANQLLYSSAANTVGGLTSANTAALVTNNTGVPAFTAGTTANRVLRTDGTTISFAQVALATDVSGTLPVGNGGTGLTSYTTGDIVYASASGTLASLVDVATGNVVISGGVGVAPSYGKVGLTTHVSGTLPVANGGTGLTAGTQGGVLYYSVTGTLASSGALTASALVVGGGASGPSTITTGTGVTTALGVNTGTAGAFVVNGGALGTPSSGNLISCTALPLSTGVTGTLGVANGGTGATTFTANGILYGNTTGAVQVTAQGGANTILTANAGAPSFSATPTIGTSVTVPLVVGGTAASSTLTLQSTSGAGTSDSILFKVGNNGATTAMSINTTGNVGIGTTSMLSRLEVWGGNVDIQQTGFGIIFPDNTFQTTAYTGASGLVTTFSAGTTGFTPSTATSGAITLAGTLVAANGGTGQSTYTIGDILFASAATTLSKLADVATGNVVISGGVGVAPSYGKVGLTTHVTGTLPVANGGTGLTSYTTGDIVYASAAGTLASLADVATGNVVISGGVGVAPSYGKVGLTTHVTGTLPVANGGTGLTSGTSGGVLYYSATGTLASSGALAASALVVGGGAGAAPSTITTGTGVTTALGVNTGTAGAFVVNGGALGTPSSGNLISCTALPLSTGVTGTLALTNGGTNASLTASNGGVIYSTASAFAVLAGTATAGQHLQSGASGAPSWTTATFPGTATGTGTILRADGTNWAATTATYPATTTANQLLYSSAANTIGGLTSANTAALVTNSSGVPAFTAGATANRVLRTDGTTISFAQVALGTDVSGTLPVGNGGTGLTSYTTGDIVYASAAGTLASLADVATGNVVISGGVGVAPSYGKVGLTTHVTGTLPVANGGTGLTAGTSGGVLYYSATGTLASSGALAASALVVGGGAGAAPSTITTGTGVTTALGVNTGSAGAFVVNGGALGTPSSGNLISCTALPLTTGVTGTLPVANGGTGLTAGTSGGVLYYSAAGTLASSALLTQFGVVYGGGAGAAPVATAAGTTGQLLTATTGGAPSWGLLDISLSAPDLSYKKIVDAATVGTNITLSAGAPSTLDGVTLALNSRILVKDQTAPAENGIYYVTTLGTGANGTWTRAVDADAAGDVDGATVAVSRGTLNGGRRYVTYFKGSDTLGTTAMYWNRLVDANASAQVAVPTTAVGIDIAVGGDAINLATGSIADLALNSFAGRTITATGASTYTRAATVYIGSAPTASTNATFTNAYALYVAGANSAFIGNVGIGTSTISSGNALTISGNLSVSGQIYSTGTSGNISGVNTLFATQVLASGTVGIGTSTGTGIQSGNVLTVWGNVNIVSANGAYLVNGAPAGGGATITDDNSTNTTQYPLCARATSGSATTVYTASTDLYFNPSTGTLSAVIFNSLSDISVKENVSTIENATDTIGQMRGVGFNWKRNGKKSYGVIAQELEQLLPELVDQNADDGTKSVNYSAIIGFLIEAVKELKSEIVELNKKIQSTSDK